MENDPLVEAPLHWGTDVLDLFHSAYYRRVDLSPQWVKENLTDLHLELMAVEGKLKLLARGPICLSDLMPAVAKWRDVVRRIEFAARNLKRAMQLDSGKED